LPKTTAPIFELTKEKATIKMDDYIDSEGEVSTTKKKSDSDADNVPVSMSEEEKAQMELEDEEKDSKAASTTIKMDDCIDSNGEVSSIKKKSNLDADNDNDEDEDDDDGDKEDDKDDDEEDTDNDDKEDVCDFDLNDIEGMSEYELMCLQRVHRNNARLASLGLLGGMTSNASPSANRTNRKKRVVTQGDYVRRV